MKRHTPELYPEYFGIMILVTGVIKLYDKYLFK